MNIYTYICFLSSLSIFIGFITAKISDRIQYTIAVTATSMVSSLVLLGLGYLNWFNLDDVAIKVMQQIDFKSFLLDGILGFLLFAGALGIKLPVMKTQKWEITSLALFSTATSTFLIAGLFYFISYAIGFNIDFIYCLLFGSLISPTDPIAVLAIIKNLKAPRKLSMKVEGESLFNDGVGLVIFTTVFAVAFEGQSPTITGVAQLFLTEAIGGILFGLIIGVIAHFLISATDDSSLEILLTLTIPTAGFITANLLHVSGALSMVVSGIMIGNWTRHTGFSEHNKHNFNHFWEMIDHFLNSLLFLLIGLALLLVNFSYQGILLSIIAIPVCLLCRYISVWIPFQVLGRKNIYNPYTLRILTWGGLRGGLSLAMALSIPRDNIISQHIGMNIHELLLIMTYSVVMFSILIQGTTIEAMVKKSKEATMISRGYVGLHKKKN
ncbi:sodium/proton antiporter (CPA1 family) [Bisgaardia hudsonensis]|uniref:Sodium/proton antiporter (CPA1 family) n=1 Tax=Bisgaardia hudsonensis TaxID=109472 RepID=A0A4R2N2D6_9PAST|nr:sodium:proton antiporter [Bisgaardia hudsonensis]QLB12485.1 sodium:proton antiporter [Bisgaardia hudsonensis]TCP14023.1 sodium/proton antiporter (CPA1 family) [Bisgaardia hudsonensis]